MHNHFIIKSLALTRPGGMVALLTSSFTLDATNPGARREMNGMADLLGAVRLPTGAFRRSAGTEALTDLPIFRRREPDAPASDQVWETVTPRQVNGHLIKINAYYDVHPKHVLGAIEVGTGMYGEATVSVRGDIATTPEQLHEALTHITDQAIERDQVFSAPTESSAQTRAANIAEQTGLWDGTIVAQPDNMFTVVDGGRHTPLTVPQNSGVELRALLELRNRAHIRQAVELTSLCVCSSNRH